MRFVPVKNVEQQAVLALHRVRQGFIKARTTQANQIRGLLAEFGLIVPQGIGHIAARVPDLIEDASNELPGSFRILVEQLVDHCDEQPVDGAQGRSSAHAHAMQGIGASAVGARARMGRQTSPNPPKI